MEGGVTSASGLGKLKGSRDQVWSRPRCGCVLGEADLVTRWGATVDPARAVPLPEHPRPQLTRETPWASLNGEKHAHAALCFSMSLTCSVDAMASTPRTAQRSTHIRNLRVLTQLQELGACLVGYRARVFMLQSPVHNRMLTFISHTHCITLHCTALHRTVPPTAQGSGSGSRRSKTPRCRSTAHSTDLFSCRFRLRAVCRGYARTTPSCRCVVTDCIASPLCLPTSCACLATEGVSDHGSMAIKVASAHVSLETRREDLFWCSRLVLRDWICMHSARAKRCAAHTNTHVDGCSWKYCQAR
jgi:hypothetical protein